MIELVECGREISRPVRKKNNPTINIIQRNYFIIISISRLIRHNRYNQIKVKTCKTTCADPLLCISSFPILTLGLLSLSLEKDILEFNFYPVYLQFPQFN